MEINKDAYQQIISLLSSGTKDDNNVLQKRYVWVQILWFFLSLNLKIWQFKIFNMTNDRTQVQLLAKLSDSEWIYIYDANFQTIQCKFSNKYITNLMQVFKQICQINATFKAGFGPTTMPALAEEGWSRTWNYCFELLWGGKQGKFSEKMGWILRYSSAIKHGELWILKTNLKCQKNQN